MNSYWKAPTASVHLVYNADSQTPYIRKQLRLQKLLINVLVKRAIGVDSPQRCVADLKNR